MSAIAWSNPAMAEWVEVRSTNFRYFSEDDVNDVKHRVTNLEKLDQIVRTVTGNKQAPSPLPVVAFELAEMEDVQETMPGKPRGVAAYYASSPQGAHLVTFHKPVKMAAQGSRLRRTYRIQDEVTQHEYMHHLMFQYFPTNYPAFYPEGFAEYYGTLLFEGDDKIVVGHAPNGRLESMNNWLDARKLLTAKSYADVRTNVGGLYAEGWLLVHMAASRPERGRQLQQYLRDVSRGVDYEKAATDAFGDLDQFDRELRAYKNEVTALTIKLNGIDPGPVTVRKLSEVEEALVPVELDLRSSVRRSTLDSMANRVEAVVRDHPGDSYGAATLALTRYLAGEEEAALTEARHAIAIDPQSTRGNMVVGMILADRAQAIENAPASDWEKAREYLRVAVASDETDTWSRIALYDSYGQQGLLASPDAQNGLMRALNLMPRNANVRYKVARDFEMRGMVEDAIFVISPEAFGTFDGDEGERRRRERMMEDAASEFTNITVTETALDMLRRLEAKRDGRWDAATQSIVEGDNSSAA